MTAYRISRLTGACTREQQCIVEAYKEDKDLEAWENHKEVTREALEAVWLTNKTETEFLKDLIDDLDGIDRSDLG